MLQTKSDDVTEIAANTQTAEPDRQAILDELNRILRHPLFTNSKRYPNLLRHVVDQTLAGCRDGLRERTLGVEVFGRDPNYDTNADPSVRTTATEIRKRLQHYYKTDGRASPIRIQLPAGSYVPEFITAPSAGGGNPSLTAASRPQPSARTLTFMGAGLLLAVVGVLAAWSRPWVMHTALDRFWDPVLASSNSILICIGGKDAEDLPGNRAVFQPPQITPAMTTADVQQADLVALADATALSRVAGFLQTKAKSYQVRREQLTTFADLRNSPTVLIGAFNNAWSLRLASQLRFSYERDVTADGRLGVTWIADRQNPKAREWKTESLSPYAGLHADYALITRVLDPETQRWVVIVGGLLKWGTLAAAEFLADPRYMEEVFRRAPAVWQQKGLQIVIGSRIYGGTTGPPQVLATHFW